jgi:hypothetical protein
MGQEEPMIASRATEMKSFIVRRQQFMFKRPKEMELRRDGRADRCLL